MGADGISTDQRSLSAEDMEALDILESSTHRLLIGHYEVGVLWKRGLHLPNNRLLANRQLDSLLRGLRRKPTIEAVYQETIDTDLQKGFFVAVDDLRTARQDNTNCLTTQ